MKNRDQNLEYIRIGFHLDRTGPDQSVNFAADYLDLCIKIRNRRDDLEVHAPLQCSTHSVDAFIHTVRRCDDIEPRSRIQHTVVATQLRYRDDSIGEDGEKSVLQGLRAASHLLEADNLAVAHASIDRAWRQGFYAGAFFGQNCLVPAVQQLP